MDTKFSSSLQKSIEEMERSEYMIDINNQLVSTFILSIFNISSLLKDISMMLGVLLTKINEEQFKNVINVLYINNCKNDKSNIEIFNDYIKQLVNITVYSNEYYKKNALTVPTDKICNDMCSIILDKSHLSSIASLATAHYLISYVNSKFNNYARIKITNKTSEEIIILNESNETACLLFSLLENETDENMKEINTAIIDTSKLFLEFMSDITKIFQDSSVVC